MGSEVSVSAPLRSEPTPVAPPRRSARVLNVDRAEPRVAPATVSGGRRGLIERAFGDAANAWSASDGSWSEDGSAYALLSILGHAVEQVLAGKLPDLQEWPVGTPMRDSLDRLRRSVLEQSSAA